MEQSNVAVFGGKTGLLGQALAQMMKDSPFLAHCPGHRELDLFNPEQVEQYLMDNRIKTVFNAVAYTRVDQAEEDIKSAQLLNRDLPALLGGICRKQDLGLVHFSTDFVFDGQKNTPYTTEDEPGPESVYGRTKLEGEKVLLSRPWDGLLIIRTAWLFGPHKTNFVDKILSLARERDNLNIVHDQVGSPTYTLDLASCCISLVKNQASGLYHLANKGEASWCELASEAIRCAGLYCKATPIPSKEFPQKATRPSYSVLDCSKFSMTTGIKPRPWTHSLRDYIYHYQ
ncbi:MAG: dTDP-4-dehydrorhamnose reductase [Desulfonatronovibrionaceae bacterium]